MSNTVILLAATGETRRGKSLSTADEEMWRLRRFTAKQYGWPVPILWVDIDYPLVNVDSGYSQASGATYEYWGPSNPSAGRPGPLFGWGSLQDHGAVERIVAWGGTVWTDQRRGWFDLAQMDPPMRASREAAWALSPEIVREHLSKILDAVRCPA